MGPIPKRRSLPGIFVTLAAIFTLLGIGSLLSATTVVALGAQQLVQRAESIIHAVCFDKQCYLDDNRQIVTYYSFRIIEKLKGDHDQTITFVQPGGEVRGYTTLIPGLSPYRIGEEVVLFLEARAREDGLRFPVGLDQGVFRVNRDPRSGNARVRRNLFGLQFVAPRGRVGQGKPFPVNSSLEELKTAIRARLDRSRGK